MPIQILIVEDDIVQIINIEQILDELGGFEIIGICKDGNSVLKLIDTYSPDIILMDIKINGLLTGLDVSRIIKEKGIPTVFMTQYPDDDFFRQALLLPKTTFLVKPFHKFTLASAIQSLVSDKTIVNEAEEGNKLIYIRVGNKREIIQPDDIIWVESTRNYCTIQTAHHSFIIRSSLKSLYAMLPKGMFMFIHKSYVVRRSLIKRIDIKNKNVLIGTSLLPLGRHYIHDLNEQLKKLG